MKITILARANYVTVQRHACNLVELGHEVTVVSLQKNDTETPYQQIYIDTPTLFNYPNLQYFLATLKIWRVVRQLSPDILDFHGASTYGLYALLPWKTPLVLTVYGTDIYIHAARSRVLRILIKHIVNRVGGIWASNVAQTLFTKYIGVDISNKHWANSWGVPKKTILRNAGERRKAVRDELGVPSRSRVILHSRRANPFWRLDHLVEAIPLVLQEHPNTLFWFAYAPPTELEDSYIDSLQMRLQELECENAVQWLGYSPHERIISIMHAADIFVCIGENDMLSSSVQEALVTGLVPILVDIPSYREVVEHETNGFLLTDITPTRLSRQINFALDDIDVIRPKFTAYNQALFSDDHDQIKSTSWLVEKYRQLRQSE